MKEKGGGMERRKRDRRRTGREYLTKADTKRRLKINIYYISICRKIHTYMHK